jgi:DNA-binding IclR family transcriptional regulator
MYVSDLEAAGEARAAALREADTQLDRIARLLPDATGAGLSLAEIARITGVSRPTLYQLRARYGDDAYLGPALLQAVASTGLARLDHLATSIGRPESELWPVLEHFTETDVLELEPVDDEEGTHPAFALTEKGHMVLDVMDFEDDDASAR